MRRPALFLAGPFVPGLAVGGLHAAVRGLADLFVVSALCVLAGVIVTGRGRAWQTTALAVAAFAFGMSTGARDAPLRLAPPLRAAFAAQLAGDPDPIHITGVMRGDAQPGRDGGATFVLESIEGTQRADGAPVPGPGGIRVSVGGMPPASAIASWREGSVVRLPVFLRVPATYRNPGVEDGALALARRGIALVATTKSGALIEVIVPATGLDAWSADVRHRIRETIRLHLGGQSRAAAVCLAILIGDRTGLDEETTDRLRRAGTFHVIAISGGNVALFTAGCLAMLRVGRVPPRAAAALTVAGVLAFALVVERGASVDRAVTVAVVYLVARAIDHHASPLNVVGLVAVGLGWLDPAVVFDVGFLLTFGATMGLLAGASRLASAMRSRALGRLDQRRLAVRGAATGIDAVAATLAAEAAVAPIAAVAFGQVTFAGIILNLVAVPAMALVQAGGMTLLAVSARMPLLVGPAVGVTTIASHALVDSAALVDYLPWLVIETPRLAAMVRTATPAVIPPHDAARLAAPLLTLTFLDVGQGDATLVQFPSGTSLLVDAGGTPGASFDMGSRVVVPALRALGVSRLTWLVLTHGDPDHIGGAARVIDLLRPSEIWEGVPVPPHAALADIDAVARQRGTPVRHVLTGEVVRIDGAEVRVLHPPRPEWERQRVRNDDSIVLEIRYGDVAFVLPGDIGGAIERALLPQVTRGRRLVLKAGHHGSLTSSTREWVAGLRPDAVVFSAGRANRFGHPAPAVLARVVDAGSEVFRTDRDGAVRIATDGTQLWAVTMDARRWWMGQRR